MLEKLIEILAALIASIDKNTAALSKGATPAPEATEAKTVKGGKAKPQEKLAEVVPITPPAAETPPVPTVEDVRTAATVLLDLDVNNDKKATCPPIKALREKYGVQKISDVAPEKRTEVIAALNAAIAEFKAKPAAREEV